MGKKRRLKLARQKAAEEQTKAKDMDFNMPPGDVVSQMLQIDAEIARLNKEVADLEKGSSDVVNAHLADLKKRSYTNDRVAHISLGDLFDEEQGERVMAILGQEKSEREIANDLRAYLRTFQEQLSAKGMEADYLAHMLLPMIKRAIDDKRSTPLN
jgi:hypothetical protein